MMKKYNYCAGPAPLSPEVYQKAAEALENFNDTGLSILEISHRSDAFLSILADCNKWVLELLSLENKGYQVLFLQGSASMEFARVPLNLLKTQAGYIDTGVWAQKAINEARKVGQVKIVASSEDKNYSYIPQGYHLPEQMDYLHCTSNNTIYGTQMNNFPDTNAPLVCDMSSDIFSRKLDFSQFGLIYAGAQKNISTSGLSVVIIHESLLSENVNIPNVLSYKQHFQHNGLYHTPPVFAVYLTWLNLQWLIQQGGVEAMEKINRQKATMLYQEIDNNYLFFGTAQKQDRSLMNVCFRLVDENLSTQFDRFIENKNITGIQGHRYVGGYRVSLYNAVTLSDVEYLITCLKEFENEVDRR
ncbi:MAG TPA: 3-phosphoserine/phosphohydroxythreonine transaminase [Chitinispirillaceae bacterium]|nr:3-phosphoserine/phosphohydroxythreonine transaminase [Chitinispirillaceae bacterium]